MSESFGKSEKKEMFARRKDAVLKKVESFLNEVKETQFGEGLKVSLGSIGYVGLINYYILDAYIRQTGYGDFSKEIISTQEAIDNMAKRHGASLKKNDKPKKQEDLGHATEYFKVYSFPVTTPFEKARYNYSARKILKNISHGFVGLLKKQI